MPLRWYDPRVSTIAELVRQHVRLPPYHISHLQHLVAEWELLADLHFSDLLLFVPADESDEFVVLAHQRPTNSETTYLEDPVGRMYGPDERPWVAKAWETGEMTVGVMSPPHRPSPIDVYAVPVRRDGALVAVLSHERWREDRRRASPQERAYADAGRDMAIMISEGTFPYRSGGPVLTDTVRAGDGFVRLDADLRIKFRSPNATSAFHRLGVFGSMDDVTFRELGVSDTAVHSAVATGVPASDEFEDGDVSVLVLGLPLVRAGHSTGCLVLVRDVSELRRRDRLLLSKEAAIREIHHRVKNNLQTIASLLQLQARRTDSDKAKEALSQSVRRIRSIALVHEMLSREAGGWLPFNSILYPLLRDVEEGIVGERRIRFAIDGEAGILPAEVATPLAVVLTELLQNAVEHGFVSVDDDEPDSELCWVRVRLRREDGSMRVEVEDNGSGFPAGFDVDDQGGLGLKIVRALVAGELNGEIEIRTGDEAAGGCVAVTFPVPFSPQVDALAVDGGPGGDRG